ncbi:MAG: peptidoglycan editing factor PgeF [Syntrophales bacterium]
MFTFAEKGPVKYLESNVLREKCGFLVHAFLTRGEGVSAGKFRSLNFSTLEGDTEKNVSRNWRILAAAFQMPPERFFTVRQVHGDRILILKEDVKRVPSRSLQYDAIITPLRNLAIGIKTADCVPIFLVDPGRGLIGAVHAGWRGTLLNIAGKAVDCFFKEFSSRPSDLLAVIGPAIGQCCYEVDNAVRGPLSGAMHNPALFFRPGRTKEKWMLDLPGVNRYQLFRSGLLPENITSAGICTSCNREVFFSHRGEGGGTGRQLNFIMLKGPKSS